MEKYETVKFYSGLAVTGTKTTNGFEITTEKGDTFSTQKLIFATGVKDIMPDINGFAECWGISIIHCPYCHGYEYKHDKTGILANGDMAFEMAKLIHNWTKDLTIFTNGKSILTAEQTEKLAHHNIIINEALIDSFEHSDGHLEQIVFKNGEIESIKALYARPAFEQHCNIPQQLGCKLTELDYIEVNLFQQTTVNSIYACGDNTTMMRAVSQAVATGGVAGAMVNKELIEESF